MRLILLLLTTTTLAQQPCWVNSAGNLECLPFKIKEFAQQKLDSEHYRAMYSAKSDSLNKCIKSAGQFVKETQEKQKKDKEECEKREKSLMTTADNNLTIGRNKEKDKKIGIGIFVGCTYFNDKLRPVVGVGATYNVLRF